jgi:hypothetical protein
VGQSATSVLDRAEAAAEARTTDLVNACSAADAAVLVVLDYLRAEFARRQAWASCEVIDGLLGELDARAGAKR